MDFSLILILALAAGAMFLMTNRSRKAQKEAAAFRTNLAPGQEVMTGSGLFGTIVDVDEEKDIITIESTPGTQTRWLRAAIAKLVEPPVEDDSTDEQGESTEEDAVHGDAARTSSVDDVLDVPDDLSGLTDKPGDKRDDGTDSK
ncbi:preprotein translocase subunit YajC [Oerskovia turbata]|uniref:Preprotein translocase subunit YajC n=1 Tax=Oerskovia turbata TaxID=1713 RepID=A0A4V1N5A8_9CELL|nr:preprotein translocase subunit YajC [Oerskovia turbata]RXR24780.1 preprotein translocase subunit YajC [Oerskovia turbata]RXR35016.1 preprotein translocase subunit YajC [Oerskovia turbata]TGJ97083.1 preprotein translocase subunit YajC [Actinotalea fermentans ATCC 43279 = JCM 9966 = DSM 3133]